MRIILTAFSCCIFIILFNSASYSQNLYPDETDTNITFLSIQKYPYSKINLRSHYAFDDIYSYENFIDTNQVSGIGNIEGFDFSNKTLALINYRGLDCHSRFTIRLVKDEEKKLYDIIIGVIHGGCRAGGRPYSNWISIPRLPPGYTLQSTKLILNNEGEKLLD